MDRKQRISYLPVEAMDDEMRAEMDRCAREGTPRPESSAVRAHVPACFWSFARSWEAIFRNGVCDHAIKELCRVYVSRSVKCEYCGNQRSEQARANGLAEGQYDGLDIEHHEVMAGTAASMAPGFGTAQALAESKASQDYWARKPAAEPGPMPPAFDTAKPHSARVYDYYLGGKDHFAADRETGQKAMQSWPAVRTAVRENRAFLGRAIRYLAREAGIRQFLDIGADLPSAGNVHEVAQAAAPESRVVCVDNDPIVLAHSRALLRVPGCKRFQRIPAGSR